LSYRIEEEESLMPSAIVIATAIESAFGALLNGTIIYLVLSRGRKVYHYIFAALLTTFLIWDLGVFLLMIRNQHLDELPVIALVIGIPCAWIQTLILHFTLTYLRKPVKWLIALVYTLTVVYIVLQVQGMVFKISGVHQYAWGNIFAVEPTPLDPVVFIFWYGMILPSCWLLYRHSKTASNQLERRHARYIMVGFLVAAFAIVKVLVVMGINVPLLLPLGMFLTDVFAAIIGVAIIKDRLLDITVIVKKGTLFSILAAILIFVFSFTEHLLITAFGNLIGGHSEIVHLVSVAVGIAVMMPFKTRLEHAIERFFAQRRLQF
jgi:hypothetical protein